MRFRSVVGNLGMFGVVALGLAGCLLGTPATASPNGLNVSITGLPANPSLTYGGPPLRFTVTLRNGTARRYRNILPIVSMGHCSCSPDEAQMAPTGTMEDLNTATGQWKSIFYDSEGPSTDYLFFAPPQFARLTLDPGATTSYRLRIAFSPLSQQGNYAAGQTTIDVTLVALPSRTVIGSSPAVSAPLEVTTS
jgi:hypothetical protein